MSPILRLGARLAALALAMSAASCGVSNPPRPTATRDELAAPLVAPAFERGVVVGLRPLATPPASESRQQAMTLLLMSPEFQRR